MGEGRGSWRRRAAAASGARVRRRRVGPEGEGRPGRAARRSCRRPLIVSVRGPRALSVPRGCRCVTGSRPRGTRRGCFGSDRCRDGRGLGDRSGAAGDASSAEQLASFELRVRQPMTGRGVGRGGARGSAG